MQISETEFLNKLADAIEHMEGYHQKKKIPTVAQRLCNPGNLEHWKDKDGTPFPEVNGFVEFPDYRTGRRALMAQCRINIFKRALTFREFFGGRPGLYKGFVPKDDRRALPGQGKNNPVDYALRVMQYVCIPFGIHTTTSAAGAHSNAGVVSIDTRIITLISTSNSPALPLLRTAA